MAVDPRKDPDLLTFGALAAATAGPITRSQTGSLPPPRKFFDPSAMEEEGGKRRRRGGANRCTKYFKYLLKGILVTSAGAIVAYGGGAAAAGVGSYAAETITSALVSLNQYCSAGPFSGTAMQTGVCSLILKLQAELVAFFAAQSFGTIQAMATGGIAVVGGWTLWSALKGAVTGSNAFINQAIDDFCNTYYASPSVVEVSTQTEAVGAGGTASQNAQVDASETASNARKQSLRSAPAGNAATSKKITDFFPKAGGRRGTRKTRPKKMGKSRSVRRRTARTPLFIY